jgi:hypothetical protein
MIETYREGSADKKCGKCKKGKTKCSKCSHEKEESMKEDGLTADEYVAACELGINNQSRPYIRARLDAALKTKGRGKKCGNSYIPQNATCGGATDKRAAIVNNTFGKGEENLFNANYSVKSGAKVGAKRGAAYGTMVGLVGNALTGGGFKGAAVNALKGAAIGGAAGAAEGAIIRAGSKAVRAGRRNSENNRKMMKQMDPAFNRYTEQNKKLYNKRKGMSREQFMEEDDKNTAKLNKSWDKAYANTRTKIWSNKNEKRKPGKNRI